MKYFILCAVFLFKSFYGAAQSSSEVGKIALSVIMPENIDGLDASQLSKVESKIIQIVTNAGLAAIGYNNNFVIYPKFAVYETNVVEGGMENITVVTCELSLFIKQVDNNVLFSSISKPLKGSGKNKAVAINNAISKIPINDSDLSLFIKTGKEKIIAFYEEKCNDIIAKSESLVKMQDYEQAMGLLMTVPEEVSCYQKVQEKSIEAYKAYQAQKCNAQLQVARTQLAANDYTGALSTLGQIDPSTPCFKDSQVLAANAGDKIDAEEKKKWDFKMKVYNDKIALEKQRLSNAKAVAIAYYKSRPTSVRYYYLIR